MKRLLEKSGEINSSKLIVLAPDTEFKNAGLDMTVLEHVKKLNCEVMAAYIEPGWIKDENISIQSGLPFSSYFGLHPPRFVVPSTSAQDSEPLWEDERIICP